jgi:hypothetical protein
MKDLAPRPPFKKWAPTEAEKKYWGQGRQSLMQCHSDLTSAPFVWITNLVSLLYQAYSAKWTTTIHRLY